MSREQLDRMLDEIRTLREETLAELVDLTEAELYYPTEMARWTDVRRVLLRFGDHMREHANQVEGDRAMIGRMPTMPQRILAEAELAWGKLLASTVGLTDDGWVLTPPGGGWSVQQVLEHIKETERGYLDAIRAARRTANRRRSYRQVGHTPSYRQDWMKRYLHISHVPLKEGVLLQPLL